MTNEALLRTAATLIEQVVAEARTERRDATSDYWAGADDAIEWALRHLRANAHDIVARAARLARLRELATQASSGFWVADGPSLYRHPEPGDWDTEGTLGTMTSPTAEAWVLVAQPTVIVQLLDAVEDPTLPGPNLNTLEAYAREAAEGGPWTHTGIFLRDCSGKDLGYLKRAHDVDYIVACDPDLILDLIQTLRSARQRSAVTSRA